METAVLASAPGAAGTDQSLFPSLSTPAAPTPASGTGRRSPERDRPKALRPGGGGPKSPSRPQQAS